MTVNTIIADSNVANNPELRRQLSKQIERGKNVNLCLPNGG